MMRFVAVVLSVGAVAAQAGDGGAPLTPAELFTRLAPSVVVVRAGDQQGSGVFVAPALVVTNAHVVKGAATATLVIGQHRVSAQLVASNTAHDLALLSVKEASGPPVTLRRSSELVVGERVYAIGSPRGLEHTLSEGLVSGLRAEGDARVVQTSAPISPGSSGGGLFDASGNLVGVTTWQRLDGQNLNFANPAEWVEALLRAPPTIDAPAPAVVEAKRQVASWERVPEALAATLRGFSDKGVLISHVAFTPSGGWVVTAGKNGFDAVTVPAAFLSAYREASGRGARLRSATIGASGWAFLIDDVGYQSEGLSAPCTAAIVKARAAGSVVTSVAVSGAQEVVTWGRNGWWARGVPDALIAALSKANDANEATSQVALRADGAWVLLRQEGRAWTASANAPASLVKELQQVSASGRAVTDVAFEPSGGWVVLSL